MNYKELKNQFEILSEDIISIIVEASQLVFNQAFTIKVGENSIVADQQPEGTAPGVKLEFDLVANAEYHHRIHLDETFGLKLMGWMLQSDPDEKLSPEHIEGIQEAVNQITGQLRTALDGMNLKSEFKNVLVSLSNSESDESWTPPADEGIRVSYTIATGEETFIVDHFYWQTAAAVKETPATPDEPEIDVDELFADQSFVDEVASPENNGQEEPVTVHPASFSKLSDQSGSNGQGRNINMLLDVELAINVELGKKTMQVKDVLKLGKGTVVELDKAAGEPLDLYVSGRKFAEGEVVVVEDHFGVRITQLAGTKKRLESLGQ